MIYHICMLSAPQMMLLLCSNLPAPCHHHCQEMLLLSLRFWASYQGEEGHLVVPTNVKDHPAVEAKAKEKMRLKLVRPGRHNRRLYMRPHRWVHPPLCLWWELGAVHLCCSKKQKMEFEWQETRCHHNKMEKSLRGKQMA